MRSKSGRRQIHEGEHTANNAIKVRKPARAPAALGVVGLEDKIGRGGRGRGGRRKR